MKPVRGSGAKIVLLVGVVALALTTLFLAPELLALVGHSSTTSRQIPATRVWSPSPGTVAPTVAHRPPTTRPAPIVSLLSPTLPPTWTASPTPSSSPTGTDHPTVTLPHTTPALSPPPSATVAATQPPAVTVATATAPAAAPVHALSSERLLIPAIGVDAPIVPVGLDVAGNMAAPSGWYDVGWYRYGPRPGFSGSAVLAGHLDTNTGAPAVFWRLGELAPGQEILYQDQNGEQSTFVVEQTASYPWDQVPLDLIFARGGEPRLTLITCGGTWSRENQNYSLRTVVYTRPG